jgi:hypothetical protein
MDSRATRSAASSAGTHSLSGRRCGGSLWCSFDVSARRWRQSRNLRNHGLDESTDSHVHGLPRNPFRRLRLRALITNGLRETWTTHQPANGLSRSPVGLICRPGCPSRRSQLATSARRWRQSRNLRNHRREESIDTHVHGLPRNPFRRLRLRALITNGLRETWTTHHPANGLSRSLVGLICRPGCPSRRSQLATSARRWRQGRNLRNSLRQGSTDSHVHGLPRNPFCRLRLRALIV